MGQLSARTLGAICWASAGWALSFGLGSQVVTHWLHGAQASNGVIGLAHAVYYLGLTVASLLMPRLLAWWGTNCAVLGLMLSGVSLAIFPWVEGHLGWFLCRWISGAASAMTLIPLEAIISRESGPHARSRNFGFYSVALALGGALGIWLGLHFFEVGAVSPFCVGGLVPTATALILWQPLTRPALAPEKANHVRLDWQNNFLSFSTGWCQGFLEGGMLAFLSLYLVARGMSADAAGTLMGSTMIGVILFQVPVGWLADRLGRRQVLLGCYAVVLAGLIMVPLCESAWSVGAWLFVFGACAGALYPLGLALLGERVAERDLVWAYSWFLALECVGSQMGSAAMGLARDHLGEESMFSVGGMAVVAVLGCAGGLRWISRNVTAEGGQATHATGHSDLRDAA